jgi:hypothetical protein
MRWFMVGFVSLALAVPSSAASVSPKILALSQADVPQGYFFDKDNSLLVSKATINRSSTEEARFLRRLGFEGAYFGTYLNTSPPKWKSVHSGAYVFRAANGARAYVRTARRHGLTPLTHRGDRIQLGDEAWLYEDTAADETGVAWRHGRVVAYVTCTEMAKHHALALALARKQQRRIVSLTR